MSAQEFNEHLGQLRKEIDAALAAHLDKLEGRHGPAPAALVEGMRYAVLQGGKRIRPALALAACEAVGAPRHLALPLGCAVELIHAYSLVHDDLPCMDNDLERRGQPTAHVRFGEPLALLIGDALQAEAFRVLTASGQALKHHTQIRLVMLLSEAAAGMVGGQVYDIDALRERPSDEVMQHLHAMKTGALFLTAVLGGGIAGGASLAQQRALERYGRAIGRAFQLVDDLLDLRGAASAGDAHEDAVNLAVRLGPEAARAEVARLTAEAREAARALRGRVQFLLALTDHLETRDH
jgi:geranylgeranyl pyrophosphate synthase